MTRSCTQCKQTFVITPSDLAFLDQVSPSIAGKKYTIPPPTHCPTCRLRRRLAFRNHTALFSRLAWPNGQAILSMYPETAPFPVMRNEDYFTDSWDPLDYGQAISFETSFFAQFAELSARVPRYARISIRNENCDFSNNVSNNKNLYLVFATSNAEDCMYSENVWGSKDCVECTNVLESERCYDCTMCFRCYNLQSSEFSENCSDSYWLSHCRGCKDCFGCVNLRNQQYCIWNEQKTKEEYETFINNFNGSSWQERQQVQQRFEQLTQQQPRPHAEFVQAENCTGNVLTQCTNVQASTFIQDGENLKNCLHLYEGAKDCMDHSFFGRKVELTYECCSCGINVFQLAFCIQGRDSSSNLLYCYSCDSSKDCFGCISLRKKQYCIFNRQYSKEDYEQLVPQIIALMKQHGEWGEFFPAQLSPIPYNRSIAQRYFPIDQTQAEVEGLLWNEEDAKQFPGAIDSTALLDDLPASNAPLTVNSQLSGRPFRITEAEMVRYHTLHAPLPRITYEERMDQRAKKLGGTQLYQRTCAKSGKPIQTTYTPDCPYIIWDRDEYEQYYQ